MCTNPARTFGLPGKGTLEPGTDADVVLFDPNEEYTISAADNASVADYSIYEGREVTGRVKKTFLRGELIADDGDVVGEPGYGEYVHRERPDWSPNRR
jgi:dihydropyrimidinase